MYPIFNICLLPLTLLHTNIIISTCCSLTLTDFFANIQFQMKQKKNKIIIKKKLRYQNYIKIITSKSSTTLKHLSFRRFQPRLSRRALQRITHHLEMSSNRKSYIVRNSIAPYKKPSNSIVTRNTRVCFL